MAHEFVTTAELLQLGDGNISDIDVSELLEDAPLLRALHAQDASHDVQHEWLKKTAAPAVGFRSINDGRENKKATYTKVTRDLQLFDASMSIDVGLLKSQNGDRLRRREAMDHLKASFAAMEKQILYGTANEATGFEGFADEATVDAVADAMVVNATGTTANTASSVWAIRTAEEAVSIAYGANGRIEIGEEYPTVLDGSATGIYDAMRTPLLFWAALQIGSSLDIGRIVNLTAQSGKGLTDLLLSQLYEAFPASRKPQMFAMGVRSVSQLQQSRTTYSPTGKEAPFPTEWNGVPILVTDQITATEPIVA